MCHSCYCWLTTLQPLLLTPTACCSLLLTPHACYYWLLLLLTPTACYSWLLLLLLLTPTACYYWLLLLLLLQAKLSAAEDKAKTSETKTAALQKQLVQLQP